MKIVSVVGARPNFIKINPLCKEFSKNKSINHILIHTGQHYDPNMSDDFFKLLNIQKPNINLNIGQLSRINQISEVIKNLYPIIEKEKPDIILVVGDVNSTVATALVASDLGIPLAHVESGLRSFDKTMPEEVNRILTDQLSNYLFTTEKSALKNLEREGIDPKKVYFVGNVMIDTLVEKRDAFEKNNFYKTMELNKKEYFVITLHRPSNIDTKEGILKIYSLLKEISKETKLVFPMHPRTKKNIETFGFKEKFKDIFSLIITDPLDYIKFMNLVSNSRGVLTDSGGIQEETTYLQIPCLTLRENTERPITIEVGTNTLVNFNNTSKYVQDIINNNYKKGKIPELWDGQTAKRIVDILLKR